MSNAPMTGRRLVLSVLGFFAWVASVLLWPITVRGGATGDEGSASYRAVGTQAELPDEEEEIEAEDTSEDDSACGAEPEYPWELPEEPTFEECSDTEVV